MNTKEISVKPVLGFPDYLAFSDGRIYSTKTKSFIGNKMKDGYININLYNGKKSRHTFAHIIIAETFLEKPVSNERLEVNHRDCNRSNNSVSNLEWVTHTQNINYLPTKMRMIEVQNSPEVQAKRMKSMQFMMKKVRCVENGMIFNSVRESAEWLNVSKNAVSTHLNHPNIIKSIKNLHFVFV